MKIYVSIAFSYVIICTLLGIEVLKVSAAEVLKVSAAAIAPPNNQDMMPNMDNMGMQNPGVFAPPKNQDMMTNMDMWKPPGVFAQPKNQDMMTNMDMWKPPGDFELMKNQGMMYNMRTANSMGEMNNMGKMDNMRMQKSGGSRKRKVGKKHKSSCKKGNTGFLIKLFISNSNGNDFEEDRSCGCSDENDGYENSGDGGPDMGGGHHMGGGSEHHHMGGNGGGYDYDMGMGDNGRYDYDHGMGNDAPKGSIRDLLLKLNHSASPIHNKFYALLKNYLPKDVIEAENTIPKFIHEALYTIGNPAARKARIFDIPIFNK